MDSQKLERLPANGGEIEKGSAHIIVELIEYEHDSMVSKSILKKATGSILAMAFKKGEGLNKKILHFDSYVQIIDGTAVIEIDGNSKTLKTGDGILIPAHSPSQILPNGRFKMLLTVIKSGYEDV